MKRSSRRISCERRAEQSRGQNSIAHEEQRSWTDETTGDGRGASSRVETRQDETRREGARRTGDFALVVFGFVQVQGGGLAVQGVHRVRVREQLRQELLEHVLQVCTSHQSTA